jgi:hypothetical protein
MMIKNISNLLLWGGALAGGGSGGGDTPSGGEEWIGDGNTHIWIHLEEGRTSPMLGVGVNGTVTVDWGDGTTPDVLTGTSWVTKYTPNHNYASAGDYVITLTVSGTIAIHGDSSSNLGPAILRHSTARDNRNYAYRNAVKKVELGNGVIIISDYAFQDCYNLTSITIPEGVTSIGRSAFSNCNSLTSITIPEGVTSIGISAFSNCDSLTSITIPEGVTSMGDYGLQYCYSLTTVSIANSVPSIGSGTFTNCYGLTKIRFEGATPPTVPYSTDFNSVPTDCIISVPVGSLDAYKTATNYPDPATYTYVEE